MQLFTADHHGPDNPVSVVPQIITARSTPTPHHPPSAHDQPHNKSTNRICPISISHDNGLVVRKPRVYCKSVRTRHDCSTRMVCTLYSTHQGSQMARRPPQLFGKFHVLLHTGQRYPGAGSIGRLKLPVSIPTISQQGFGQCVPKMWVDSGMAHHACDEVGRLGWPSFPTSGFSVSVY